MYRYSHRLGALALSWFSCALLSVTSGSAAPAQQTDNPSTGILLRGTVVTMDAAGTILHNGSVLVREGRIVAAWQGAAPPAGTLIGDATIIDLGPDAVIFPGLINLHNH